MFCVSGDTPWCCPGRSLDVWLVGQYGRKSPAPTTLTSSEGAVGRARLPDGKFSCNLFQVVFQYAGDEKPFQLTASVQVAAVAHPGHIIGVERATRMDYNLFKLQFTDRATSFFMDFAKL